MLYERWRETVARCGSRLALADAISGRQWTFSALAAQAEALPEARDAVFPQGDGPGFVLEVLRGWRDGVIVCPLEANYPEWPMEQRSRLNTLTAQDIVHLKTTSATTGSPRRVVFTAEQLAADAGNIVITMGLRAEWPNLGVISLAHSYGFSNLVLPLLLHGIPLLLIGSPLPEPVKRAAAGYPEVTLAAVPALWRAWLDAGSIPPNVRLAISAGAPLPIALETGIYQRFGLKVHNFYGSSECGGIAYDASGLPRSETGNGGDSKQSPGVLVGAPMSGVDVRIGPDGCVEVRGAAVSRGYWPEESVELGGGVFRTSDLGALAGGLLYLKGRAGDQINVAGRKVSPETVESVLLAQAGVAECVVFGAPSPEGDRGEMVVACVRLKPGATLNDLRRDMLQWLPAWQVPRKWWVTEELQTNQRGKVSRTEWRRKFLERVMIAGEEKP